jgi:hypothetical protein
MNNQLLYFPYISVPNSEWTTRSILYWDNVGAIVPQIYRDHPSRLGRHMRDLVEKELIQQVFPYNYVHKAQNFDESFIRLTQNRNFGLNERRIAFQRGEKFQIHLQKVGERLMDELVRMGIAQRKDWEWYYVETKTARLFMMYLASVIAEAGDYTPATDAAENIDLSIHQKGLSYYSQKVRGKFLEDLMPYPLNPDLTKLKKFKEKHNKELKHFRTLLEQSVLTIASIKDKELRNSMYDVKKEEILDKKESIAGELKSSFGQITYGTLFGLAGAVTSFVADQHAAGLFSLGNAVYSSFQGYDKRPALKKDYSYLALIDKKLR